MAAESSPPRGLLSGFLVLRGALPELWVVFGIKLLAIVAYSLMNKTFVLWMSSDLGLSDRQAAYFVFLWSSFMTLSTVAVGSLTDAVGLRRAFIIGVWVCIVARAMLTFAPHAGLAIGLGLIPLAIGEALGTPVMVAAVRRFSTTAQRSMAFSIFYAAMNVGFWISSTVWDWLRRVMGEYGSMTLPIVGVQLSTYETIFLASLLAEILLLPLVHFLIRDGIEATDQGVVRTAPRPAYPGLGFFASLRRSVADTLADTGRIFVGLWQQPGFYKFLSFLALAACVRLIFVQMDYVFPKFGIRELGEGAPFMTLWGLNSILIIFLVPVVGLLIQSYSAYSMVLLGSAIAAASVFILALPTAWFEGLAGGSLGHLIGHQYLGVKGEVHPYYVMIFFYVIVLSVGEAIYSPRLYEYAAAIAPKGQEGSYMAMSILPLFVAKLLVAPLSGELLARFCPEHGPRDSATLWLIIACITAIAPLGLLILRPYIRVSEAGRG